MSQRQRQTVEDPLAGLARFKLVFILDDSPSMSDLWDELRQALMGTVRAAIKHQRGGIDIERRCEAGRPDIAALYERHRRQSLRLCVRVRS